MKREASTEMTKKKLDPQKLSMVSDYLKRTISERPYGYILASLAERLQLDKLDYDLRSMGLIAVPPDFNLKKLTEEKSVAFVPYCCKPFDCPLNVEQGRKSSACNAMENEGCEHQTCTIKNFVRVVKKLHIEEFLVIDADANLFRWLADKKNEGYKHTIGVACEFAISYAFEVIHGQLEYDGLIIMITGDKCRTKEEYAEMDSEDRGRLTFIDEWTLVALEEIIDHINGGELVPEEGDSATVDK